ncbi:MAG TPA: hypothetical protein DCZ92_12530 [Elusimicrobia bacterium]|nr:MAG: hypothetical protein A2016_02470 [Elusimicrobia bacterium GWF2_62_30]HBA61615.1 hypothetical protein [Elusimicrobiota bacterium]
MLRRFILKLSDRRLREALAAVEDCGLGLGDLALAPGGSAAFFKPVRQRLLRALAKPPGSPAGSRAAAAAEDFTGRLEKFFSDLALHGTLPDDALRQALLCLQRACEETPALLSLKTRARALARISALSAAAAAALSLARGAADARRSDFPANLKFSSMYSGLDAVFGAFGRCAQALYQA